MRSLHHFPLDPGCRLVRLALAERRLDFDLRQERFWSLAQQVDGGEGAPEWPSDLPILIDSDGSRLPGPLVVLEYLEERYHDVTLLGQDPVARAETRRLVFWFLVKLGREAADILLAEKVTKRLTRRGTPDSAAIRAALTALPRHLDYIAWLSERRRWLAGDHISGADLAAAASLSVLDFLDAVPWDRHPEAKDWYQRLKSRPSFQPLLADTLPGMAPPRHYADLDF